MLVFSHVLTNVRYGPSPSSSPATLNPELHFVEMSLLARHTEYNLLDCHHAGGSHNSSPIEEHQRCPLQQGFHHTAASLSSSAPHI